MLNRTKGESKAKAWLRRAAVWLLWIALWQAIAAMVRNPIIFVGPFEMLRALWDQLFDAVFWQTIGHSFGKISLGFLGAFATGLVLGSLAYRFPFLGELLEPFMSLIRSIPVASFVILALIWIGSGSLSVCISYLVVLPIVYVNTIAGLASTDPRLLEMARVFHMPALKKVRYIYVPALMPYLVSGCKTALGMSWKSGIAAEVIGIPDTSIGEQLYYSKLYLDTAGLFAWTFVIVVVSAVFEQLFLFLLKRFWRQPGQPAGGVEA